MNNNMKKCNKCGVEKLLAEFYTHNTASSGHQNKCSDCCKKYSRKYSSVRKSLGLCIGCGNPRTGPKFCDECRIEYNRYMKAKREEYRASIYKAYGSRCACCGESEILFLSIDHVLGGGRQHRLNKSPYSVLVEIINKNFPKEFQLLCHSCNQGKNLNNGICPGSVERGHHGARKVKEISLWDSLKLVQDYSKTAIGE